MGFQPDHRYSPPPQAPRYAQTRMKQVHHDGCRTLGLYPFFHSAYFLPAKASTRWL